MKSLKRSGRQVKKQEKAKRVNSVFMSMNLPSSVIKGINRSRYVGIEIKGKKA